MPPRSRSPRGFAPLRLLALAAGVVLAACTATAPPASTSAPAPAATPAAAAAPAAEPLRLTILQLNDVYEITPVEGGRTGGLARVATVRKRLLADNPNVLTLLAGDLISPSALGTAKVDGERLNGRQMVAVLDAVGLDATTLGNHEFDLGADALRKRLEQSRFAWICANATLADGSPLPRLEKSRVIEMGGVKVGIVGAVTGQGAPGWVKVSDPIAAVAAEVAALRPKVDVVVALTHLAVDEDRELVRRVPGIDLVVGGHEHDNQEAWGEGPPIFKADSNAKTVWVHDLWVTPGKGLARGHSRPLAIGAAIADDPEVNAEVGRWVSAGFAGFRALGFEPGAVVARLPHLLDARDELVRSGPTEITSVIADALMNAVPGTVAAVFNSGSVRIDDVLPPGPMSQYDVLRVLPFGGELVAVEVRGDLLGAALDAGASLRGQGGFLQFANIDREGGTWRIAGEPIRPDATYRVASTDYLANGRQPGIEFFGPADPRLKIVSSHGDLRNAVIAWLGHLWPATAPAAAAAN